MMDYTSRASTVLSFFENHIGTSFDIHQICRITGIPLNTVKTNLTRLYVQGLIRKAPNKRWQYND